MDDKEKFVLDLINYKFDYQYYLEKANNVEKIKKDIENNLSCLKDMKSKMDNVIDLDSKIKEMLEKQSNEEDSLIKIISKKQEIEKRIDSLPQPYKNILFFRYVQGLNYEEISIRLNYSLPRIFQLHKLALEEYKKKCN